MRILLDECLPRKLKTCFPGQLCETAPEAGFAGKKNGDLLSSAEASGFELLLTMDKGIPYEQNLKNRAIAVMIIRARSNRLADLLIQAPECLRLLESIEHGQVIRVGP